MFRIPSVKSPQNSRRDDTDGSASLRDWLEQDVRERLSSIDAKIDIMAARFECVYTDTARTVDAVEKFAEDLKRSRNLVWHPPGTHGARTANLTEVGMPDDQPTVQYNGAAIASAAIIPLFNEDDGEGIKETTPLLSERAGTQGNRGHDNQDLSQFNEEFSRRRTEMQSEFGQQSGAVIAVTQFLEEPSSSALAGMYDKAMTCFICASVLWSLAQTVETPLTDGGIAMIIETCIDILFAVEVMVRLIFCLDYYIFFQNFYNYIDAASMATLMVRVMNFVAEEVLVDDSTICAIMPTIRFLKLLRRFRQFHLLVTAFQQAFEALPVLLYTMAVMTLIFSSSLYLLEPRENLPFYGTALWLTCSTVATVGYGDIIPSTDSGYLVVSVLMVISMLYMAMPIGIIGISFTTIWTDRQRIMLVQLVRERLSQWGYKAEDMQKMFRLFDIDSNGTLDVKEFQLMISEMQLGLMESQVLDLFQFIDTDSGGTIDDAEFVKALYPREFASIYVKEFVRAGLAEAPIVVSRSGKRLFTTGTVASVASRA